MKIKVTITKEERNIIRQIAEGLTPFKSIFSFNPSSHSALSVLSSNDSEKSVFDISLAPGYAVNVLKSYSQHIPSIMASAVALATSFRGLCIQLREKEIEWENSQRKKAA